METMAKVQADTLDDSVKRIVMAQQFADEWLLVAMNDYDHYSYLMEEAASGDAIALADKLRDEWETLAEQVTELVEEKISPEASLFIGQFLKGQGQLPFDFIAREVIAAKKEQVNA
jgi:tRNA(Ser,Leu) C12 N-acetylase TAN1